MKIIGHRGAKGLAPENTLASFRKALEHHVDAIEFDVRVTKDGQTILSHDAEVHDQTGNGLSIADHTFKELQAHKPDLTTLEEALKLINHQVPVIIEVKTGVPTKPIIPIVQEVIKSGWPEEDLSFTSYNQAILLELHAAFPDTSIIVIENWSSIRARRRMKELGTNKVSMLEYWLWGGFIRAVSRGNWELYCFPPKRDRKLAQLILGEHSNNPRRAHKWAQRGLAGVITDYPDRFEDS